MFDGGHPIGTKTCHNQSHPGANVGGFQLGTSQQGGSFSDHSMRITHGDVGPHSNQLVDEEHAGFVHPVMDQAKSLALSGQNDGQTHQVGGKGGPETCGNPGRVGEIDSLDLQLLVPHFLKLKTELFKDIQDGPEFFL